MKLPPEEPTVVTVHDIVAAVIRRYTLPADRVWQMTVPDLMLMLSDPDGHKTATNAVEAVALDREAEERRRLLAGLTVAERLELEAWITELT